MINTFVWKKRGAILFSSMLSVILFAVGNIYYGFYGGIGFLLAGFIITIPVASLLLKNPFTDMLEGKGLLALNLDSTGIIFPFIVRLKAPFLEGILKDKNVKDIFDRSIVSHLAVPESNKEIAKPTKEGGIEIKLNAKEFNDGRFALFHYPVLIYNEQIQSIITKDFLSEQEKNIFAEHSVLYLNRKMEELTAALRDFGRYIVENLKPKAAFFDNKIVRIITIVLLVLLVGAMVVMLAPKLMAQFQGLGSGGGGAFSAAKSAITPIK